MNDKAIVTLAIGKQTQERWKSLCQVNWETYARVHGVDLIVIDKALDISERALQRSPAWQKCLVFSEKILEQYTQVAWFDTDIFFNPIECPNIFDGVPLTKVGAVDSFSDPSYLENQEALRRLWKLYPDLQSVKYQSPEDIYSRYGKPIVPLPTMINAGVLVSSPSVHGELFKYIYNHYEDRGAASYYENVPLSYELCRQNQLHFLNPKFNHLWTWSKLLHYPFLMRQKKGGLRSNIKEKTWELFSQKAEYNIATECAAAALINCYCLHFAGYASEMNLINLNSIIKQYAV